MQRLGNLKDPLEQTKVFIKEICKVDPDKIDLISQAENFKKWSENVSYEVEPAPTSFKIDGRTFYTKYLELDNIIYPTPLDMQLQFLIEAANVELEPDSLNNIDNITALMYREDWSKPYDQGEYLSNALFFEKQKCKYSLWGRQKYNELILTLRDTYPILYTHGQEDDDKENGRKMFDLLNAVAQDNPSLYDQARNVKISDAFAWMEMKKKESIKQKHEQARQRR